MTLTNNCPLYTKEGDGTIQKWYVNSRYGDEFSVSTVKNAGFSDYTRYYHADDIGKTIFMSRKDAKAASAVPALQ